MPWLVAPRAKKLFKCLWSKLQNIAAREERALDKTNLNKEERIEYEIFLLVPPFQSGFAPAFSPSSEKRTWIVHDWRDAAAAAPCTASAVPDGSAAGAAALAGGAKKARSCVAIARYTAVLTVSKVATEPTDKITQTSSGG